jgi:hypothetical protein
MHQLILTVIALTLIAGLAVVTANYLPTWATHAKDAHVLVETGAKTLINAFDLRARANDGVAPLPDGDLYGNGLTAYFNNYYPFLPRAPQGYAWSYGFSNTAALLTDGYPGGVSDNGTPENFDDDGLFWFCLHPTGAGATEGIHRGIRRAQQVFPETQMYVHIGGAAACGHPINSADPSSFPSNTVVTVFVRYIPDTP